jgi:general secretion pathway protein M
VSALVERITVWWNGREARERLLLALLAVLLAALAYWYGVFAPLDRLAGARAERQAEVSRALVQARGLAAAIRAQEAGGKAGGVPVEAVQRVATAEAIELSPPEPQAGGDLAVSIEAVSAKPLFNWLSRVQREAGVGVRRFEAHRSDEGAVQVRVVFAGRSS